MEIKDIDKYYLEDLKCEVCGKPLTFLRYDRFSDTKGHHFIVARMWCDEHKDTWIQPPAKERIYLDGSDASSIKNIESVHNTLSLLASTMEGKEVPLGWNLSMDFWGFREDFSDAVKAKLQIFRDFEEVK